MTITITAHDVATAAKWVGVFVAGGAATLIGLAIVFARDFRMWR